MRSWRNWETSELLFGCKWSMFGWHFVGRLTETNTEWWQRKQLIHRSWKRLEAPTFMVVCSMICLTFDKLIDQCVLAINTTVLSWVLVLVIEIHPNSNQSDLVHGPPSGSQVLPMSRGVFPWNSFMIQVSLLHTPHQKKSCRSKSEQYAENTSRSGCWSTDVFKFEICPLEMFHLVAGNYWNISPSNFWI